MIRPKPFCLFLACLGNFVLAAPLVWEGGLSADWNTTEANWREGALWSNTASGTAQFGDTGPRTVTLAPALSALRLVFDADGYLLKGNSLTLAGSGPGVTTSSGLTTLETALAGTDGFSKDGNGTLVLKSVNPLTGKVTVNAGTLAVDGPNLATTTLSKAESIEVKTGATLAVLGDNALTGHGLSPNPVITLREGAVLEARSGAAVHLGAVVLDGGTLFAETPSIYGNWNFDHPVSTTGLGLTSRMTGGNAALNQAGGTEFQVAAGDTLIVSTVLTNFIGNTGLIKTGGGTLRLSAANTFTGPLRVREGLLDLAGAGVVASPTVSVSAGATLGGSGAVGGAVTVAAGAKISPGNSSEGTMLMTSLSLAGTYECDFAGEARDRLMVGDLDLTGASLVLRTADAAEGHSLRDVLIATYSGKLTGNFASVTGLPPQWTLDYSYPGQIMLLAPGFDSWATVNGLSGLDATIEADPDGDGSTNSLEFLTGGHPGVADSPGLSPTYAAVTEDAGAGPLAYYKFSHRQTSAARDAGTVATWEISTDLASWKTVQNTDPGVVIRTISSAFPDAPETDLVEAFVPVGIAKGGRLFARLRIAATSGLRTVSSSSAPGVVPALTVVLSRTGSLQGIATRANGRQINQKVTGFSLLEGFSTTGAVVFEDLAGGGYEFTRTMRNAQNKICVVTESFAPTAASIRWEMKVVSQDAPSTAFLEMRLNHPVSATTRFWAPRVGGETWEDPLAPTVPANGGWAYGGGKSTFCIPVATFMDTADDTGVSLVLSPEQSVIALGMHTGSDGHLRFTNHNLRIGEGREVKMVADLVPHEADWRGGIRWMAERYPSNFDPPNPQAAAMAGSGSYSHHSGAFPPADVSTYRRMAYGINWSSSFYWPYFGMYLPPVSDDTTWMSAGHHSSGEVIPELIRPITRRLMNEESGYYVNEGFHLLNYFNVTEFGSDLKGPEAVDTTLAPADRWKDATTYLYTRFPNAMVRTLEGGPYGSWSGSRVMDPGDADFQDHLLEQVQSHLDSLPLSSGLCIDRMDWLAYVNYSSVADDGIGWHGPGRKAAHLGMGWNRLMPRIGSLVHGRGKSIFVNPVLNAHRLDYFRHVDGIYDETGITGESGYALNGTGMIAMRKPAIAWTTPGSFTPDKDSYFQRLLHLGVFPTAPVPGNDHQILPDAQTDAYFLDYGPLFDALRGKRWVLENRCVETTTPGVKVNLFSVPGGYTLPVTFGGNATTANVRVRNLPGLAGLTVVALHPGVEAAVPVAASLADGVLSLTVPLKNGCAVVRLSAP